MSSLGVCKVCGATTIDGRDTHDYRSKNVTCARAKLWDASVERLVETVSLGLDEADMDLRDLVDATVLFVLMHGNSKPSFSHGWESWAKGYLTDGSSGWLDLEKAESVYEFLCASGPPEAIPSSLARLESIKITMLAREGWAAGCGAKAAQIVKGLGAGLLERDET